MLFVTLQALFFMVFFKWQDAVWKTSGNTNSNAALPEIHPAARNASLISRLKGVLAIGVIMFLLTFCKNIAIGSLGAIILFFIIQRNWRSLAEAVAGYAIVRLSFEGIKAVIWGASNQYGSQGAILLQKDAYNPAAGNEDINGFITRFFENFNLYTGKRLYQILGFKDPDSNQAHVILSLLALVLVLFAAWRIYVEIRKASAAKRMARSSSVTAKNQVTDKQTLISTEHPVSNSTIRYADNVLFVLIYILTLLFMT